MRGLPSFLPSSLNLVGKKIFPDTEAERADLCADSSKYTVAGESGIQTSNLLTTRRPTLPPEPQLPEMTQSLFSSK